MRTVDRVGRWVPLIAAIAWAGVIFHFSSMGPAHLPDTPAWDSLRTPSPSGAPPPDLSMWEWITRKGAHILQFAMLGFLVACAAAAFQLPRPALIGWVVATMYGALDEAHQSLVPGRTAQATDVFIDAIGALVGVTAWWYLARHRSQRRRSQGTSGSGGST